jgi:sugar lactone lactonase YvrE
VESPFPGATGFRICAGDESPVPQFDLVAAFDSLWVACRGKGQVLRIDPETGAVRARIPARGVVALAAVNESVWGAYREAGTVYEIDPKTDQVASTVELLRDTPYIWSQAGSVWVGIPGNVVGRFDPGDDELAETIDIGDGVSDMVMTSDGLLAICHRDSTLWRVDPDSGQSTLLGEVPGDTPERLALAGKTLWTAGRGVDLMQLDPKSGKATRKIEVGTGTIDVAATDAGVWVAVALPEADRQGLRQLERLVRVDPTTGKIEDSVVPTGQVFVTGLATEGSRLWVADTVDGVLVRLG